MPSLRKRLVRNILLFALTVLTWFNASPAWASDSEALYIDSAGVLTKIGAVSCNAPTAQGEAIIAVDGIFATTLRQNPGSTRTDTGLRFDRTKPATMVLRHRGITRVITATEQRTITSQTLNGLIPAVGVPPFPVVIKGAVATKGFGYRSYFDRDGNRAVTLLCGTKSPDDLPTTVQAFIGSSVKEIRRLGGLAIQGTVEGLTAPTAFVVSILFQILRSATQQLI
ncbi:MAG: hypothetical protein RBJ76_13075 [Stenomitos frigidus ULC029]